MTWQPGREKIADLLQAAELERVTPDRRIAERLLADASRHLATAAAASSSGDLSGAYQLAYDAFPRALQACWPCRDCEPPAEVDISRSRKPLWPSSVQPCERFGPSAASAAPATASSTRAHSRPARHRTM